MQPDNYVQIAQQEFKSKKSNFDMRLYELQVRAVEGTKNVVVIFSAKNRQPGRGNTSLVPEFEVEIDPGNNRVVSSNFVK